MKKPILFLLFLAVQTVLFAQEYYPEGTRWVEIRLDTLKNDSWYSKVGNEWIPNFETIEYYVQGEYVKKEWDDFNTFKKVYTNGPGWTDSLTLMIQEGEQVIYNEHDGIWVSVPAHHDGKPYVPWPGQAYQFDWSVGKGIYYENILGNNVTSSSPRFYYGIIGEIKEGDFGGVRPLKYVDLNGKALVGDRYRDTNGGRIIQGIGITEWDDGECLFGPPDPYSALEMSEGYRWGCPEERHYRSMLVHFERNGEVLYDIWPEKGATNGIKSTRKDKKTITNTLYDLQGRNLQQAPLKGVYIYKGKKIISK